MKRINILLGLLLMVSMVTSGCAAPSGKESNLGDGKQVATKARKTNESTKTSGNDTTTAKIISPDEDRDLGLRNIKIDNADNGLTDDQKLIVEYFDNDYFYINNDEGFEFLQRYPKVFSNSQINLNGIVKKVISYSDEEYKILLQLVDGENHFKAWYGNADYRTYVEKRKDNYVVISGKTAGYRLIEGDFLSVFGRYIKVEKVMVDATSYTIPLINTFRADIIPPASRSGTDKFTPDYVKRVAKVIFGNDIEVRDPILGEDVPANPGTLYNLTSFMIVEPEKQTNAKFTKYRMWMDAGSLEDAKVGPWSVTQNTKIERGFEFTPDLMHFIVVTNDLDQKNLNIDFYDRNLNKIWNREFSGTTSAVYDYTKNNFYLVANNELSILDLKTGNDKVKPVHVGKKIEIRKLKDGLLVIAEDQSDAIMKLGLDGSILWKASLSYDVTHVEEVQLNENIVISLSNSQDNSSKREKHYLVIDNQTGEIYMDAISTSASLLSNSTAAANTASSLPPVSTQSPSTPVETTSPTYNPAPAMPAKTDYYLLADSSRKYLKTDDLRGLSEDELVLARNEIFAKHGRLFKDAELNNYFNSKTWYRGFIAAENFSENQLNDFEKKNVELIKYMESVNYAYRLDKSYPNVASPQKPSHSKSMAEAWDYELNRIYGLLRSKLSTADMKALTASEIEWINYKEDQVKKVFAAGQDGNLTLADLTKQRTLLLIDYYFAPR